MAKLTHNGSRKAGSEEGGTRIMRTHAWDYESKIKKEGKGFYPRDIAHDFTLSAMVSF